MKKAIAATLLSALLIGCERKPAVPPKVFDQPLGPITKTVEPLPSGFPALKHDGPFISYLTNGFAKTATQEDRRVGRSQLRIYNPTNVDNDVKVIVYFDNRPPAELTRFTLKPNHNDQIFSIPRDFPDFFAGSEVWAARIESTQPVIALNVLAGGIIAPNGDLWMGDPRYKGANVVNHSTRHLDKQWFFGDGLVLKGEKETDTQRFNEYEWYHVLNPNPRDAEVKMHCYYPNGESDVFTFTVKAERVRMIITKDLVRPNVPHAVEYTSSEPIAVSAERIIYDFKDTQDWGAWLHANHDGIRGSELAEGGH